MENMAEPQQHQTPETYNPLADPAAITTLGNTRITVLTPHLLRLEWAADGKFEDHASFAFLNRQLPVPPFTRSIDAANTLTLETSALRLLYKAGASGDRFSPENLSITLRLNGAEITWHPGDPDTGNLLGTARTLDQVEGSAVALEPGLISRNGWALVDDSTRPLFDSADFSFPQGQQSPWPWLLQRPEGDRLDWYFFGHDHNYRQAMSDFVLVSGRIPLPPRYAFGTWWSRFWAYSDQELDELVHGYRQRNIPLDVFVIDMDWHLAFRGYDNDQSGHRKGWSGYTWNRNLFPEPEKFLKSLHERGLKVTLNLHPASGVQPFEEAYPAMARAMGQDPAEEKYVPFQITDRKFVDNYFSILHHPLEKQGVDFWWLDWQQEAHTDTPGVNPTFWLNYLHFTDQARAGKRPLLFHRWGGLGNHRYQIGFSGDTISSWDSLAFQPGFTATAANVGYSYWSHDIGGHIPGPIDPELFTRWVQFGAFSPILRTHTTKSADAERRVWAYPEPYSDVLADTMRQRYAWIPYIYSEARRTYDTGIAFLRPLYYDFPEADEAYNSSNQYLFGDNVIVAPVTTPRDPGTALATVSIWLPEGQWIELSTGRHLTGNTRANRLFSLEQTPVYLRPGTIIPMQPAMLHVGAKQVDPLILQIAPLQDGQTSSYTLYEDSSVDRLYMTGDFTTTNLSATRNAQVLTVTVEAAQGSYQDMTTRRAIRIDLPGDWPPASVTVNGTPLPFVEHDTTPGWLFQGNTLTTSVLTDNFATDQPLTIVITRDAALSANAKILDGFAGRMIELRHAYAEMNDLWPIDDLVAAMQTGNRIGYHPENARAELERLPHLIASAQRTLEEIAEEQQHTDIQVGVNNLQTPEAIEQRRQQNLQRINRTRTALNNAAQ
jgi:alpha-glucosidase